MTKRTRGFSSFDEQNSSKKKRCQVVDRDRISELPEEIMHNIMTFLSQNPMPTTRSPSKTWNHVTTRLVSKAWNNAWNTFPVMEFSQRAFENSKNSANKKKVKDSNLKYRISPKKNIEDFCNYVEKTINRHQADVSLDKFHIEIDLLGSGLYAVKVEDILKWLDYAKTKHVRTLSFRCLKNLSRANSHKTNRKDEWRYVLPTSLLCSHSLEVLDLFGCKFLEDRTRKTDILYSLKKVSLVYVQVDQLSLQSFLSSCLSVEKVSIQYCNGFEKVTVAGDKLKKVDLVLARDECQTVAVTASNLQCLHYYGKWDKIKRSMLDSDCSSLKELTICGVERDGMEKEINQIVLSKFPLVKNVCPWEMPYCYRYKAQLNAVI